MRKKISVDELEPGMFLDEICGSWIDNPFWRSRFVLSDPKDIALLRASKVREVWIDCDADCVLYLVEPAGPSCHTGARSCFFTPLEGEAVPVTVTGGSPLAAPTLLRLEDTLASRVERTAEKSYTKSLLEHGAGKIGAKLREEAGELAEALARETDERVVSETADVVYHALVGLLSRRLHFRDVAAELARRFGTSGHDEKASRPR